VSAGFVAGSSAASVRPALSLPTMDGNGDVGWSANEHRECVTRHASLDRHRRGGLPDGVVSGGAA
jgi:hypothetical protein